MDKNVTSWFSPRDGILRFIQQYISRSLKSVHYWTTLLIFLLVDTCRFCKGQRHPLLIKVRSSKIQIVFSEQFHRQLVNEPILNDLSILL